MVLGKEHPSTLMSMDSLAIVLRIRVRMSMRERCFDKHFG
jgi:hypothetical protein